MSNSLATVHPELVAEWSEKNLPLTPDKITFGSNKRVWWKGSCGHEWQASVKARSSGEKCPICSGARVVEGINDLATLKPQLAQEWSKKNELKPTEVSVASHKKIIWKCKHGHEWTASIKSRTVNGTGCPYCSHNKVLAGFNDLASQYPEVAAEWSDRNIPLQPTMVTAFANSKAWWKCMVIDDTEEALTLSDDRIEKAVRQNHVRLVIIDPVQAFIGADVDMNRANEVRPVFRKLGMIAEKTGCAIVLIGHLNKSSGTQSTYRGLGSIDIRAAVRSLIFIGKVRKDPTTRVLIHEKSSLAPPGETMAFKLGDEEGFRWAGAYEISADELLDGKEGKATETKLERGAKLIRELLADKKEISIRELDEKAKEQGISGRTMRDVRSRMKNELEYRVNEKQKNSIRLKE